MNLEEFVTWEHSEKTPGGPLRFWDAMWSLFSNSGDFYRLLARVMPPLSARGLSADASLAVAMSEIFVEVVPLRNALLHKGLLQLGSMGVPNDLLKPATTGQDWGQSQLSPAGLLTLRVAMWPRVNPPVDTRAEAEGQAIVVWPAAGAVPVLGAQKRVVG